jgi:tripartite-type tricarboxylate transporter receptor subunit TctC
MKNRMMITLTVSFLTGVLIAAGFFLAAPATAQAADFPNQNITWVVGYKPGGGFDTYSRAIGRYMEKYLPEGVKVVVVNKPGSASQVGASMIYNAKPDGYTIGIWPMPGLYIPQMFFEPKYDVKKVSWLGTVLEEPMCLAISAKSKFRTLKDLQQAGAVKITLTGFTGPEIAAPITMEALGIKAKYITGHKGSKDALLAAMRGDGDAVIFTYGSLRKFIKQGSFIPVLLLGSKKRIEAISEVPTATEAGFSELDKIIGAWRVIGGPPDIPADRLAYLREALWKTMNDAEFLEWSKTSKRPVSPLDGEATKAAIEKVLTQYDGLKPLFERYIK